MFPERVKRSNPAAATELAGFLDVGTKGASPCSRLDKKNIISESAIPNWDNPVRGMLVVMYKNNSVATLFCKQNFNNSELRAFGLYSRLYAA